MKEDLDDLLTSYANESDSNRAKLLKWRDEALDLIGEGNGTQVVSGTGNGVTFNLDPNLTVVDWFKALQSAIAKTRLKGSKGFSIVRF